MIKLWYVKDVKKNCIDSSCGLLFKKEESCQKMINSFAFVDPKTYVQDSFEIPEQCYVSNGDFNCSPMVLARQYKDNIRILGINNLVPLYNSIVPYIKLGTPFWDFTGEDELGTFKYLLMSKEYFDRLYIIKRK